MNKILCVSTTGMGNALLYTPLIKGLAAKYPRAVIDVLVGNPAAAEVVQGLPGVRNVTLLRKNEMSLNDTIKLIRSLRQAHYDLFVSSFLDKSLKVALFGSFLEIPQRAGFAHAWWKIFYTHRTPLEQKKHEVEYNLGLLSSLGIASADTSLGLTIPDKDRAFARDFLARNGITAGKTLIGIHPGSDAGAGKTIKRWPLERFSRLADMLAEKHNAAVILFGGKEETDLSGCMGGAHVEKAGHGNGTEYRQTDHRIDPLLFALHLKRLGTDARRISGQGAGNRYLRAHALMEELPVAGTA